MGSTALYRFGILGLCLYLLLLALAPAPTAAQDATPDLVPGEQPLQSQSYDPLDSDGDGISDEEDNCPDVANAEQGASGGDSPGVACNNTSNGDDLQVVSTSVPSVSPEEPGVVLGDCVDGIFSSPAVILPETPGVIYSFAPNPVPDTGGEVTVMAELEQGLSWGDTTGWTVEGNVATRVIFVPSAPCTEVTPADPAVTHATCVAGELTEPTLTLPPDSNGIAYSVDPEGPYAAPQTVTVNATMRDAGRAWAASLPDSWTQTGFTTATRDVFLFDPDCPNAELTLSCPVVDRVLAVGDAIGYEVTIVNTGNTLLLANTVTASREGAFDEPFPHGTSPGVRVTRTFTSVVTAEDAANGHVDNEVTLVAAVANHIDSPHGKTPEPLPTISRQTLAACPALFIGPTETPTSPDPTGSPDPTATPKPTGTTSITTLPDTGQGSGRGGGGTALAVMLLAAAGLLGLATVTARHCEDVGRATARTPRR